MTIEELQTARAIAGATYSAAIEQLQGMSRSLLKSAKRLVRDESYAASAV